MPSRWLLAPAFLAASTSGYATTYLSLAEAQAAIFPGAALTPAPTVLTAAQRTAIEKTSGLRVRSPELRAWRVAGGGWFIVDEVLGKHEFITYAVGLGPDGAVRAVEIMDYRETYGGEVRNLKWRTQFAGKTSAAPLKLDLDIKNISGATLSSRHITDGVKRLLVTHDLVLKKSA
ncbi:MAG: FMN-binding protein [Undibacterium sp.]|nr:FMN-binding protein [Opitutaceae bacterium]